MTGRICIPPLVAVAVMLGSTGAIAQNAGPDEAVNSRGAVSQRLALTPAQRSAVYDAVSRQRTRVSTTLIQPVIGTPVAPSVRLSELPDAARDEPWARFLKYAMVEGDVVMVDPVTMRVVDVIRGSGVP